MFKKYDPPIVGHPYPTAGGYWRCFDGEKWRDCDKHGNVKEQKNDK